MNGAPRVGKWGYWLGALCPAQDVGRGSCSLCVDLGVRTLGSRASQILPGGNWALGTGGALEGSRFRSLRNVLFSLSKSVFNPDSRLFVFLYFSLPPCKMEMIIVLCTTEMLDGLVRKGFQVVDSSFSPKTKCQVMPMSSFRLIFSSASKVTTIQDCSV